MSRPVLGSKDYKAIGAYAEAHGYKLALCVLPEIFFEDKQTGEKTSKLLSHIHAEVDEIKEKTNRRA